MSATVVNPYIGPRTFKEEERDRFYGRERESNELLALVVSEQIALFYAQSGAGKSSLVNTCLIPDLKKKGYEVLRGRVGGDAPVGCEVLNIFTFNLLRSLSTNDANLSRLSTLTLNQFLNPQIPATDTKGSGAKKRALIIDQFEEIFSTHHESWEKRKYFFEDLCEVLERDPRLRVVLVMREDFIANLDPYASILPSRLRMRYYMQQLGYEAALKAVKEPVRSNGFSRPYEIGAAEKLVDDLRTIKVILPDGTPDTGKGQFVEPLYLQVICYELWNNLPADGETITKKNVEDVGDVSTSLGNYYSKRVATVAAAENVSESRIRKWFTEELISPTGIRNMVLQELGETSAGLENRVIAALSDLVRGEQRGSSVFYELTHDRLVEPIMASNRKWFDEHLSPLQKQANLWDKEGRKESWLLTDQALVEVKQWAADHPEELAEVENEYLEACQRQQEKQDQILRQKSEEQEREVQRQKYEAAQKLAAEQERSARIARRFSWVAGALTVIAVIATVLAVAQAKESLSGQLSAYALSKLNSQPDLAILLSLEADKLHSDIHSRNALLTMQQETANVRNFLPQEMMPMEAQFTPDGDLMAIRNESGIMLWDVKAMNRLTSVPLNGHFSEVVAFEMSSDGKLMASGAADGSIVIWDAVNRQKLSAAFEAHKGAVSNLAFHPDGTVLASASWEEAVILLWDLKDPANPKQLRELSSEQSGSIYSLAFSKDGKLFASGSGDGSVVLWDAKTYKALTDSQAQQQEVVSSLEFSPDGTMLASASWDDTVILWNLLDPKKPVPFGQPLIGASPNDLEVVTFSPDGNTLAAGDDNGDILLWDVSEPENVIPLETLSDGSPYWVGNLAFSQDGSMLAAGRYEDGSVTLWNLQEQTSTSFPAHRSDTFPGLAMSQDSQTLITASTDSSIKFWDISQPDRPEIIDTPLRGHPNGTLSTMQLSADGTLLSTSGSDGTLLYDLDSLGELGYGDLLHTEPATGILAYQTTNDNGAVTVHIKEIATGKTTAIPIPGTGPLLSPDGKTLIYQTLDSESDQMQIHLWSVASSREMPGSLEGSDPRFSSDSQLLIYQRTGMDGDSIGLWDITTAESVSDSISGSLITIAPNSRMLVYQTSDPDTNEGLIELWDIGTHRLRRRIPGTPMGVTQNGEFLAVRSLETSTNTTTVRILNTATGEDMIPAETLKLSDEMKDAFAKIWQAGQILVLQLETMDPYSGEIADSRIALVDLSTASLMEEGRLVKGAYLGQTRDGKVLLYQTTDNNGNHINLLDTATRLPMGDPIRGDYLTISPDGTTLVFRNESGLITLRDITKTWPLGRPVAHVPENVSRATLSLDGQTMAWISKDGITVQNISTGALLGKPFNNHLASNISSVLFDPNGSFVILWATDGKISFWDLATGKQTGGIIEASPNSFIQLNADSSVLLVSTYDTETTSLWDTAGQQPIGDVIPGINNALSPDGKWLAVGSNRTNTTTLWDLSTRQQIGKAVPGSAPMFSPDSRILAIGDSISYTITFWEPGTLENIGEKISGSFYGNFNSSGTLFAAFDESTVTTHLWDLELFTTVGRSFDGNGIFSPDGKHMAVINNIDRPTIRLWDISSPLDPAQIGQALDGDYIVFNSTGDMFAVSGYDYTRGEYLTTLWHWKESGLERINGEKTPVAGFAFSPAGEALAYFDEKEYVIRSPGGQTLSGDIKSVYPGVLWQLAFNETGDTLAFYGDQGVVLWNVKTNTIIGEPLPGPVIPGTDIVISPDGKQLASFATDGIILRDLEKKEDIHLDVSANEATNMMSFYADGSRFAAISREYTEKGDIYNLLTWDLTGDNAATPDEIRQLLKHDYINSWKFSPDGRYLAYVSTQNGLGIWDVVSNKPYGNAADFPDIENFVGSVTFSADGKWMAYSDGPKILLWNMAEKKSVEEVLLTDSDSISQLNLIMLQGQVQYVITLDDTNTTQVWDWASRTKIGNPMSGNLQIAGLKEADRIVYYIDPAGKLIEWKWGLDLAAYKDLLCPLVRRNFTEEEWKIYFSGISFLFGSAGSRTCPDYDNGLKISDLEPASPQVAATQVQAQVPTETPAAQPTAQPTAILPMNTPEVLQSSPATATVDVDSLIQSANILVYEDTVAEGLWIQPILREGRYKYVEYVYDGLGDFKTQLTSPDIKWDLVIVAAESRANELGEYWDYIKQQIDQGTPVIIETWAINQQGEGRIKPILDGCGVRLQSDLPFAVPLRWYVPDHPLLNTPHQVEELSRTNRFWDRDAGDLMELAPGSSATIVAGTSSSLVNSGVIVSCYDGRLILQTFSNHDYPRAQISELWENYIYNLLYNRFSR